MSLTERVPLAAVRDLIAIGQALPFRVLDTQSRLLLNEGQTVGSDRQFEMLNERGAWVERAVVERVRGVRAGAVAPAVHLTAQRQATLFDLWDQALWDLDDLYRRLAHGKADADQLEAFAIGLQQLIDRDVDISLFLCVRQDDRRFALYASHHGLHCAVLGLLLTRQLAWEAGAQGSLLHAALTMNVAMADLQAQMGELNDLFVARARYLTLGTPDPTAWFALGWLAARIAEVRALAKPKLAKLAKADPLNP